MAVRRSQWPKNGSRPPTSACGKESDDLSKWWTVLNDPVLDKLICFAYQENLTLRQAGFRILEARCS